MKKKINTQFFIVVTLAIVFTMIITTVVYYKNYQSEVMEDLKNYAITLNKMEIFQGEEVPALDLQKYNIRITMIEEDGDVTFDSDVDVKIMENHSDREEVKQALATGEGYDIRQSETMEKTTYYYAFKQKNGIILRVAKISESMMGILYNTLPVVIALTILLYIMCMGIAHFLTKSILKPIKEISADLDNIDNVSTYKEIMPFIRVIHRQHADIIKSAKIRQEFTANVTHELKTPLTSISGYSELIVNGMATETDIIRFAREINSSSQRLLALINDILKLSELDSNDIILEMEEVDLYALACTCKDMLDLQAKDTGVSIHVIGDSIKVNGNKRMLEEVIYNLCDNAIRYNKNGGYVKVYIRKNGENIEVAVEDDGIGIPAKDIERIFERFYRVDKSRSKKTGGTGLGLAIVKHIVERHNAKILVESQEGKGTTIRVIFEK